MFFNKFVDDVACLLKIEPQDGVCKNFVLKPALNRLLAGDEELKQCNVNDSGDVAKFIDALVGDKEFMDEYIFKECFDIVNRVKSLSNLCPTTTLYAILGNKEFFKEICEEKCRIKLQDLCRIFDKNQKMIFEATLENGYFFKYVNFDPKVFSKLAELCDWFSNVKPKILKALLANKEFMGKGCILGIVKEPRSAYNPIIQIKNLCNLFPDQKKTMLNALLGNSDFIGEGYIFRPDKSLILKVEALSEVFPKQKETILKKMLKNEKFIGEQGIFHRNYNAITQLETLCGIFPDHKKLILETLFANVISVKPMCKYLKVKGIKELCDAYPDYQDVLLDSLIKNVCFVLGYYRGAFVNNIKEFADLFSEHKNHKDNFLNAVLQSKYFLGEFGEDITSKSIIEDFKKQFPDYKEDLDNAIGKHKEIQEVNVQRQHLKF